MKFFIAITLLSSLVHAGSESEAREIYERYMATAKEEPVPQGYTKYKMGLGTSSQKKIGGMTCKKIVLDGVKPQYSCSVSPKEMNPQALYNMFYDINAKETPRDPNSLGEARELTKEFFGLKCRAITALTFNPKPQFDCDIKLGDSESASDIREKYNLCARELETCEGKKILYKSGSKSSDSKAQ